MASLFSSAISLSTVFSISPRFLSAALLASSNAFFLLSKSALTDSFSAFNVSRWDSSACFLVGSVSVAILFSISFNSDCFLPPWPSGPPQSSVYVFNASSYGFFEAFNFSAIDFSISACFFSLRILIFSGSIISSNSFFFCSLFSEYDLISSSICLSVSLTTAAWSFALSNAALRSSGVIFEASSSAFFMEPSFSAFLYFWFIFLLNLLNFSSSNSPSAFLKYGFSFKAASCASFDRIFPLSSNTADVIRSYSVCSSSESSSPLSIFFCIAANIDASHSKSALSVVFVFFADFDDPAIFSAPFKSTFLSPPVFVSPFSNFLSKKSEKYINKNMEAKPKNSFICWVSISGCELNICIFEQIISRKIIFFYNKYF